MKPPAKPPVKLPVLDPWYADGLSFGCTQCGNCCTGGPGYVWVSDTELDRMAAHLQIPLQELAKKYCRRIQGKISLKEHLTERGLYDCVFLKTITDSAGKEKRVCGIYEVRPLQCRTWPFWDGLLASQAAWDRAKRTCPGLDKGRKYSREEIENLRDAQDWPNPTQTPGSQL
jgi:Fe-S-cluster containining protein